MPRAFPALAARRWLLFVSDPAVGQRRRPGSRLEDERPNVSRLRRLVRSSVVLQPVR